MCVGGGGVNPDPLSPSGSAHAGLGLSYLLYVPHLSEWLKVFFTDKPVFVSTGISPQCTFDVIKIDTSVLGTY